MYYPKECYSININVTKNAKREYEERKIRLEKAILEKYPNYYDLGLKERYYIRKEIEDAL